MNINYKYTFCWYCDKESLYFYGFRVVGAGGRVHISGYCKTHFIEMKSLFSLKEEDFLTKEEALAISIMEA